MNILKIQQDLDIKNKQMIILNNYIYLMINNII